MYYLYSFPDNGIKYRDKMLWFCEIRIKIPEILYQFINIRKWFKASFQDSCDPGDQNTVICNRDVLILTAGDPVFHLSFIQHTAAAVYNQFVILHFSYIYRSSYNRFICLFIYDSTRKKNLCPRYHRETTYSHND